mmetsp:Transcript_119130/g.344588  ORF Transcript_119130/g.344588 Transcript_119130/m.344588 type:complete len:283 (-) Transcript_119130:46-894(-)
MTLGSTCSRRIRSNHSSARATSPTRAKASMTELKLMASRSTPKEGIRCNQCSARTKSPALAQALMTMFTQMAFGLPLADCADASNQRSAPSGSRARAWALIAAPKATTERFCTPDPWRHTWSAATSPARAAAWTLAPNAPSAAPHIGEDDADRALPPTWKLAPLATRRLVAREMNFWSLRFSLPDSCSGGGRCEPPMKPLRSTAGNNTAMIASSSTDSEMPKKDTTKKIVQLVISNDSAPRVPLPRCESAVSRSTKLAISDMYRDVLLSADKLRASGIKSGE